MYPCAWDYIPLICFCSFVTARSEWPDFIQLIANYPLPNDFTDISRTCRIWEAARATAAGSALYDPIAVGNYGKVFTRGYLAMSNPVDYVLVQAKAVWSSKVSVHEWLGCLLSIGCGSPLEEFSVNRGSSRLNQWLDEIAMMADNAAESFALDRNSFEQLYRLSNNTTSGDADFGAIQNISFQDEATVGYLMATETTCITGDCIQRLSGIYPIPGPRPILHQIATRPEPIVSKPTVSNTISLDLRGLRLVSPEPSTTGTITAK